MTDSKKAVLDTIKNMQAAAEKAGRIDKEAESEKESDLLQRIQQQKYQYLFGPRFVEKDFDNYEIYDPKQKSILEICQHYIKNLEYNAFRGHSLGFIGKPGTGKNHLVYALARKIIWAEYSLEMITFFELMRRIKTAWDFKTEREQNIIDKYVYCDFLILEEIGIQYNTGTEKLILFDILDKRYKYCKPFIITSNLSIKEFKQYIDFDGYGRIWSRLNETGRMLIFDWEDYRARSQNKQEEE